MYFKKSRISPMTRLSLPLIAAGLILSGCNDTRDLAPERADRAWHPHKSTGLSLPASIRAPSFTAGSDGINAGGNTSALMTRPDHPGMVLPESQDRALSLPQLIDLAERNNPRTRVAWEAARQAAIGVGMSRAAMLPQLTFSAMGGYQRMALPLPNYLSSRGYLTSNGAAAFPKLELDYLLLDFGRTRAQINEAKYQTLAANFGFSAVHQQLILDVISAYHAQQAAQAIVAASHHAVENMAILLQSAQSRHDHGEATIIDVATAQRNLAQARFDLDKANDAEHGARHALLEVTGLPATLPLAIDAMPARALPRSTPGQIRQLVDQALASRPDLMADIAKLRASDEAVLASKAALRPRVAFAGTASGYLGGLKTYGTGRNAPASTIAQPEAGAFLQVSWPIYQGGLRANAIHMAESRRDEAEATLLKDRLSIERQVADSQDALETALAQVKSAEVLNRAAQTANDGATQAYAHGVGTMTDASTAAAALFEAQAALAVSTAQAFTKAAALAHATGQLDLVNNVPDTLSDSVP